MEQAVGERATRRVPCPALPCPRGHASQGSRRRCDLGCELGPFQRGTGGGPVRRAATARAPAGSFPQASTVPPTSAAHARQSLWRSGDLPPPLPAVAAHPNPHPRPRPAAITAPSPSSPPSPSACCRCPLLLQTRAPAWRCLPVASWARGGKRRWVGVEGRVGWVTMPLPPLLCCRRCCRRRWSRGAWCGGAWSGPAPAVITERLQDAPAPLQPATAQHRAPQHIHTPVHTPIPCRCMATT